MSTVLTGAALRDFTLLEARRMRAESDGQLYRRESNRDAWRASVKVYDDMATRVEAARNAAAAQISDNEAWITAILREIEYLDGVIKRIEKDQAEGVVTDVSTINGVKEITV